MKIAEVIIDENKLLSKEDLLWQLEDDGAHDRALSHVRERYSSEFGNELMWRYPISDGKHAGTFIVAVREGFISIPYDEMDAEDYEIFVLEDAVMLDSLSMQCFINNWNSFSHELSDAMNDMLTFIKEDNENAT